MNEVRDIYTLPSQMIVTIVLLDEIKANWPVIKSLLVVNETRRL